MTSTLPVLRRVVSARVYGAVAVPMSLQYDPTDPVALRVTLGTCSHRRTWHVARAVIAARLTSAPTDDDDAWLGDVVVSRLPGRDRLLMGLRSWPHRWLVTVAAADLERFLGRTYTTCPPDVEQRLIDAALDAHLQSLFHTTEGGPE